MRAGLARSGRSRCAGLPRAPERPVRRRLSPAESRCVRAARDEGGREVRAVPAGLGDSGEG